MKKKKYDFSGYATVFNVKCADGRIIKSGAFKDNEGAEVPIVWEHMHDSPENVLGHSILTNDEKGVYARCSFNNNPLAKAARELVKNGDVKSFSIHANRVQETNGVVTHGNIIEVSLVLSGANPKAKIDNIAFEHSDGSIVESEDEVIIESGLPIETDAEEEDGDDIEHSDDDGETIGDIFNTLNEKQKKAVYAIVAEITGDVEHSDDDEEVIEMNVFEKKKKVGDGGKTLTHSQIKEIFSDAEKCGSLKESVLSHAQSYGIENIDYLFPDAKELNTPPDFISRDMEWVSTVLGECTHSPFARIKMTHADITADEARAKGYVKGNFKKEEVIKLLKRVISPTTIYKKQKLDRDDIIDITDFNVVAWLKAEMKMMLREELARAILISDGRDAEDEDKINEENIIPIWKENELYAHHIVLDADVEGEAKIEAIMHSMVDYKGSGSPAMFTTNKEVIDLLLLKDKIGRRLYPTESSLASEMGVSRLVKVEPMDGQTRELDDGTKVKLVSIVVNLRDYQIGTNKGGETTFFDDFDIDYNQYKYLYETRCSGALKKLASAIVIEQKLPVTPTPPVNPTSLF